MIRTPFQTRDFYISNISFTDVRTTCFYDAAFSDGYLQRKLSKAAESAHRRRRLSMVISKESCPMPPEAPTGAGAQNNKSFDQDSRSFLHSHNIYYSTIKIKK
ncbi:MAG: hypothetical protein II513_01105, partial [Ruminococcus sp.]|nr:hypothetical protein [Ruminococcus sp.]